MESAPKEIRPWRKCPFVAGRCYRVKKEFSALRDTFVEGELLIFQRDAWSRYDEMTGYVFQQPEKEGLRVWDIGDDADILIWNELFEEVFDAASQ